MSFNLGRGMGKGRGRGSTSPSTPPVDSAANSLQYYISSQLPPFSLVPESSPDIGHDSNQSFSSQHVSTTQEQQQRTLLLPDGQG